MNVIFICFCTFRIRKRMTNCATSVGGNSFQRISATDGFDIGRSLVATLVDAGTSSSILLDAADVTLTRLASLLAASDVKTGDDVAATIIVCKVVVAAAAATVVVVGLPVDARLGLASLAVAAMIADAAEPSDFIFLCCKSSVALAVLDLLTFAPTGTVSSLSTKLVFKNFVVENSGLSFLLPSAESDTPLGPLLSVLNLVAAKSIFFNGAVLPSWASFVAVEGSFFLTRRGTPISSSLGCCSVPATVDDGTDDAGDGDVWTESCCEDENVTDEIAIVITSSSFLPSIASRYSSSSSPPAVPSNARKPLKFSSIRLITSSFSSSFSVMLSIVGLLLRSSLADVSDVSSISSISIFVVEMSPPSWPVALFTGPMLLLLLLALVTVPTLEGRSIPSPKSCS
uniref:Uncharacterized protein n=1 Tax=Anopheles culicifacies TaxID=139723 RepID=A0A182M185_9DIPT